MIPKEIAIGGKVQKGDPIALVQWSTSIARVATGEVDGGEATVHIWPKEEAVEVIVNWGGMEWSKEYEEVFTAEAVFEKLVREYDLSEEE